jgi:hypothetical protein
MGGLRQGQTTDDVNLIIVLQQFRRARVYDDPVEDAFAAKRRHRIVLFLVFRIRNVGE